MENKPTDLKIALAIKLIGLFANNKPNQDKLNKFYYSGEHQKFWQIILGHYIPYHKRYEELGLTKEYILQRSNKTFLQYRMNKSYLIGRFNNDCEYHGNFMLYDSNNVLRQMFVMKNNVKLHQLEFNQRGIIKSINSKV